MRIPRIYTPQSLSEGALIDLDDRAANHCYNVLRMRKDFLLRLFNGDGGEYEGIITQIGRKGVRVRLNRFDDVCRESTLKIHLALGISRGDRMDTAIQKAVELGVESVTPLLMERCVVRIDEHNRDKRLAHWQGVIINACEQSGRTALPILNLFCTLNDWLNDNGTAMRVVFVPGVKNTLKEYAAPTDQIGILIGPEGGFSDDELGKITQSDLAVARLGPRTLRTETAAITAVALVQALWGDI